MLTLNIIGSGKVATTFGYLLSSNHCFEIKNILCRTLESSRKACEFTKCGHAIVSYDALTKADAYLLAVTDDQISNVAAQLLARKILTPGNLIFHCSGALSSDVLTPLKATGAIIASLHPIKSFGDPAQNIGNFENTVCTVEGDPEACDILINKFSKIGAKVYKIASTKKMLYHAATVFGCNYFVSLIDVSLQLLEKSGVSRQVGLEMLEPLILGSWQQVKSLETINSLTGPISRGDSQLVKLQLDCLALEDEYLGNLYKILGKLTLELAIKKKTLSEDEILNLEEALT